MAGAGFEPAKALPPDLQSGPFGHSGIPPNSHRNEDPLANFHSQKATQTIEQQELAVGLEPTTAGLQNRNSTVELR